MVREAGYEGVELSWSAIERAFADVEDLTGKVRSLVDAHGLVLSGLVIADMDAVCQEELPGVSATVSQQMEAAKRLGVSTVIMGGGDRQQQSLELLVDGLRILLAAGDELELDVALCNRERSQIEQIEDLRSLVYTLRAPRLRVVNDAGSFHIASVNPCDVIREFVARMSVVRIADGRGRRLVRLGQGEINVPAILDELQYRGYQGWVTVGPNVPVGDDAASYVAESIRYLRDHIA